MTMPVSIQGTVKPDGSLQLDEKVTLPAGRVQVLVQPLTPPESHPFFEAMERIWAEQRARGHVPRTVEEIEAEREAMRDESEEEIQESERIYEECQRSKRMANQVAEPGA